MKAIQHTKVTWNASYSDDQILENKGKHDREKIRREG